MVKERPQDVVVWFESGTMNVKVSFMPGNEVFFPPLLRERGIKG
jgi:hypothetical protein